ncbi:hypothetical protein [Oricola indica]|uniref:hypothetical protein n=1 Tax=Oricola indica TaxID=2872591 RepID=UPI001CBEC43A
MAQSTMNWPLAIERNRDALLRIVAMLFTLAGIDGNGAVATLPRHMRNHLLRMLRPAESAVRRLVVIVARNLKYALPAARSDAPARAGKARGRNGEAARMPSFPVIDPMPAIPLGPVRRYSRSFPRITAIGFSEPCPVPDPALPDDTVDAAGLCRRMAVLKRVLDDLDAQARRLARWRARRDLALEALREGRSQGKTIRLSAMRPGRPPGRRKRPRFEVDRVLEECHALARHAMACADTS